MSPQPSPEFPNPPSSAPSSRGAPWPIDVGSCSDRGCVRTANEDVCFATRIGSDEHFDVDAPANGVLYGPLVVGVCDGMGGAAAGEVASREAAFVLGARLSAMDRDDRRVDKLGREIVDAIQSASRAVFGLARQVPAYAGMGTTATVCALAGRDLVIGQVGDSRAYLLHEGVFQQLTRDQTIAQLMIDRGHLQPEEAATSFGAHVILQAVGTTEKLDVDLRAARVERGDVLLVCSDGLINALTDPEIATILSSGEPSVVLANRLVARANAAGATDNVTCVVVRVGAGAADNRV